MAITLPLGGRNERLRAEHRVDLLLDVGQLAREEALQWGQAGEGRITDLAAKARDGALEVLLLRPSTGITREHLISRLVRGVLGARLLLILLLVSTEVIARLVDVAVHLERSTLLAPTI